MMFNIKCTDCGATREKIRLKWVNESKKEWYYEYEVCGEIIKIVDKDEET